MNKQDLIAIVAEAGDLPKAKAGEVLDAVFEAITKSLKKKREVRLVGFGTFSTSKRKAGKGRNPRTGEEIKIPATTTVRFKAGKGLKDAGELEARSGASPVSAASHRMSAVTRAALRAIGLPARLGAMKRPSAQAPWHRPMLCRRQRARGA